MSGSHTGVEQPEMRIPIESLKVGSLLVNMLEDIFVNGHNRVMELNSPQGDATVTWGEKISLLELNQR